MDKTSILGIIIAFGGIILGNALEGGHFNALVQLTAAIIVFGGTIGAVLINSTAPDLKMAKKLLPFVFKDKMIYRRNEIIEEIVKLSVIAAKEGPLELEKKLNSLSHPYMKTVFRFVVDGVDPAQMKEIMEEQIIIEEDQKMAGAKVYSDAGTYAPTIGILGAVLGLIHIMANLTDTSSLGSGIAVAFVATIYGVASANLLFLPMANKIKRKISEDAVTQEMILAGALGITRGIYPSLLREKLLAYTAGERIA
jgi:chemotaxis protein MotA